MPRAPLTEEQKNALIERLKKAREAKQAEEDNKIAEKKSKAEKKIKPKEVEEKPVETVPKVSEPVPKAAPSVPVPKAPVPVEVEQPVIPKAPQLKPKPAKEKYAKLVFYKEPSAKKLKRMQSMMGVSSDDDDEVEVKPKAASAKVPELDHNEQKKLQYQKLSNLAHHFFDN